jgi:Tol biopolymer transport system component
MRTGQLFVAIYFIAASAPEAAAQVRALSNPADTVPALFGEGILSTGDNEFSIAFSRDGQTVYWTVSAPNVFVFPFVILMATRTPTGWSTPRVAPFSGTGFSDADPAVSPDGRKVFFMSRREATGSVQRPDFDIWAYDSDGGTTERIDAVNTDKMELFPSVTASGTLYFTSDRAGGYGAGDIYRSLLVNGRYTAPGNIGPVVNSTYGESNVYVAPDESYLVFSSAGRPDNRGATDLYIAERSADGTWGKPRPLWYVNSEWDDYAPTVSHDGSTLYFTSRRPRTKPSARSAPLTYEELRVRIRSAGNGNADIYEIPFMLASRRQLPP